MRIEQPIIDGNVYQFSYITIKQPTGEAITDIQVISIDAPMELINRKIYGAGPLPIGRTRGEFVPASIVMRNDEFATLSRALGAGWAEQTFDLSIDYRVQEDEKLQHKKLLRCQINKIVIRSHTEISFIYDNLIYNGLHALTERSG